MPPAAAVPTIALRDFFALAPEILLTAWGLLVLIVDVGWLRETTGAQRRSLVGLLALLGAGLALAVGAADVSGLSALVQSHPDAGLFFGTLASNELTRSLNLIVTALLAMVIGISTAWSFTEHWGEYFALLSWAAVGMMLLIAAEELLTLFLSLEAMTLCLYLTAAFEKDRRRSPEGGLKYFVYGSVSSALFLFGLSLLYGLTGTTRLDAIARALSSDGAVHPGLSGDVAGATAVLLVLVGFGFKIAAVPFHQWAPDAYEGAPAPVGAWIVSGSKLASLVALMKVFNHALDAWAVRGHVLTSPGWIGVLAAVSALSMTYGNLAALAQRNYKRMLAYSSIAHAGYMLVGVVAVSVRPENQRAAGAVLFYLIVYAFTTVGAFALAAWLARDRKGDDIDDLNGLGLQEPGLAVCIVLLMLSLIGMPPLAGFVGKLYMFLEALNSAERGRMGLTWLVALGLLNSVISAFYYVRVLKAMFLRPPGERPAREAPSGVEVPIVLAAAVVLVFGVLPAPLLDTMTRAAGTMFPAGAPAVAAAPGRGVVQVRVPHRPRPGAEPSRVVAGRARTLGAEWSRPDGDRQHLREVPE